MIDYLTYFVFKIINNIAYTVNDMLYTYEDFSSTDEHGLIIKTRRFFDVPPYHYMWLFAIIGQTATEVSDMVQRQYADRTKT